MAPRTWNARRFLGSFETVFKFSSKRVKECEEIDGPNAMECEKFDCPKAVEYEKIVGPWVMECKEINGSRPWNARRLVVLESLKKRI